MAEHHHQKVVSSEEWLAPGKRLLLKEKEFTRARDVAHPRAAGAALRGSDQGLSLRGTQGKADAAGTLRRPKPARRLPRHVRSQRRRPSSSSTTDAAYKNGSFWADDFNGIIVHLNPPRRDHDRGVARPMPSSPPISSAWAGPSPGTPQTTPISISTITSRSGRKRSRRKRPSTTTPPTPLQSEREGVSVFYRDPDESRLSHLFDLCARHDERRLPIHRYRAEGPDEGDRGPSWVCRQSTSTTASAPRLAAAAASDRDARWRARARA